MFKPQPKPIPLAATLVTGTACIFIALIFQSVWVWIIALTCPIATLWWIKHTRRKMQLKEHIILKLRGIIHVQQTQNNDFTPGHLAAVLERNLENSEWRSEVINMFDKGRWLVHYDIFQKPISLRMELSSVAPKDWMPEQRLAFYIALAACLPANIKFDFEINHNRMILKSQTTYTDKVPKDIKDLPSESIHFWGFLQRHLSILLDQKWNYEQPMFSAAATHESELHLPATFELSGGGYITFSENENKIYVDISTADGLNTKQSKYTSIEEAWGVWQHAVERFVLPQEDKFSLSDSAFQTM